MIPAFAKVFKGFNAELPMMTQILIGFSDFMVSSWPLLLAAAGGRGGRVSLRGSPRTEGRYAWHRLTLRLPIAGKIVHKATLARFARSFALASRSGVPLVQALTVVAQTVDNDYIAAKIEPHARRGRARRNRPAHRSRRRRVHAGGAADGGGGRGIRRARRHDAGSRRHVSARGGVRDQERSSAQIEPILIVCLGALVLVLALGIFLPIWDLGQAAMSKGK
ncbi:MAG: hypothetical protein MZV65_40165 [Chromatiales bacterium]|nr:hypothetical protein [Chromatiales bacterium]